jgi:hypothetical protein
MRHSLYFLVFIGVAAAQDSNPLLPSANDVVGKMMAHDNQRQAALHGYTGLRRYVLENPQHHKRAEMLVTMACLDNGSKEFQRVSESGWGTARSHVFPKLLEGESEASRPDVRERSRITPQNYSFEMVGQDYVNQRLAYVMEIAPKTQNKYLIQGRMWVDAQDYAIVRVEGKPAKNPSFWIKSVHFVHTYQKTGPFWLPASDRSITDARIIGATELTIEYFDYTPNPTRISALRESTPGSLP